MKRCIILYLLVLASFSAKAQSELLMNRQDPATGLRGLATTPVVVRNGMTDRHPLNVALLAGETPDGWMYTLEVEVVEFVSRAVPKDAIMLLRTKSGEVIELKNDLDEAASRDWVGQWIEGTTSKTYRNRASYIVTREQLRAISEGVIKLRLQLSGEYFDTEYKKDRLGFVVKEHLTVIDAAIASGSDVRSDF